VSIVSTITLSLSKITALTWYFEIQQLKVFGHKLNKCKAISLNCWKFFVMYSFLYNIWIIKFLLGKQLFSDFIDFFSCLHFIYFQQI
jgi:hypothetical protein